MHLDLTGLRLSWPPHNDNWAADALRSLSCFISFEQLDMVDCLAPDVLSKNQVLRVKLMWIWLKREIGWLPYSDESFEDKQHRFENVCIDSNDDWLHKYLSFLSLLYASGYIEWVLAKLQTKLEMNTFSEEEVRAAEMSFEKSYDEIKKRLKGELSIVF